MHAMSAMREASRTMAGSDGSCFFFSSSVKSMLGSNSVGAAETVRLTCLTPEKSCLGSQIDLRKYYEVPVYYIQYLKDTLFVRDMLLVVRH